MTPMPSTVDAAAAPGDWAAGASLGPCAAAVQPAAAVPDTPLPPAWAATRRQALQRLAHGALAGVAASAWAGPVFAQAQASDERNTFDEDSVLKAAVQFFGSTTEGLAKVLEKVFKEQGRPTGYIRGEEASAALTVGLRYGDGELSLKSGGSSKVYWAGPSIGLDAGANASKVFTLVYRLQRPAELYRRFPGVEGSLYWVGGAGVNYQHADGITLAPIRLGVGWRAGASIGYLRYAPERTLLPL